jgi:hypothetical protein
MHVTPGEVRSLNELAMAHGGHLTTNPHTGLPEAGFLSNLLPMIAGGALAATGVGAPMAALMIGGGYFAATGSLKKGLMAGLGAYGGAGIGSALASSGTAAAATPSVSLAEGAAATPAAPVVASGSPMGGIRYASPAPVVAPPTPAPVLGSGSPLAGVNVTPTPVNAPLTPADQVIPANSMGTNFRNSTNTMYEGVKTLTSPEGRTAFMGNLEAVPNTFSAKTTLAAAAAPLLMPDEKKQEPTKIDSDPGQQYTYSANPTNPFPTPDPYGREQRYFNPAYTPRMADGGVATATPMPGEDPSYQYDQIKQLFTKVEPTPSDDEKKQEAESKTQAAGNRPQENPAFDAMMATPEGRAAHEAQIANIHSALTTLAEAAIPGMLMAKTFLGPQAQTSSAPSSSGTGHGATTSAGNVGTGNGSTASGQGTGIGASVGNAGGGLKAGGISDAHYNLGSYSDGGRLLRGPGDGVSDSIPAVIGKKQPARLADGEFVVPARIVSELGNGSTEAGARKLYAMMDRIQKARGSTVGKGKVAKNSRSEKYLPA